MLFLFSFDHSYGQYLPETNYKVRTASEILQRLAGAIGDYRLPPELRMYPAGDPRETIARMEWLPEPVLYLDEKVYDLCVRTFGADSLNALATVLGHEAAHFYRNHQEVSGFALPERKQGLEAEADEWGLFAAGLAGFSGGALFPEVIDQIYRHYRLEDELENYVDKNLRIELARSKLTELAPYIHLFEAGQLLYLFDYYGEAARCFDFVIRRFPSREVYNNAAVIELMSALELMDPLEQFFILPLELDPLSRLPATGSRSLTRQQERKMEGHLQRGAALLEKVRNLDPTYAPGYLNLACARLMQGNYPAAVGLIIDLENRLRENDLSLPADAYTVRAIALAYDRQPAKAELYFDKARLAGAFPGELHQEIFRRVRRSGLDTLSGRQRRDTLYALKAWTKELVADYGEQRIQPKERTAGGTSFRNLRQADPTHTFRLPGSPPVKIMVVEENEYTGWRIVRPSPTDPALDEELDFIRTGRDSTAGGIAAGAGLDSVEKVYGAPAINHAGAAGSRFYRYESAGILFRFFQERVHSWTIHRRQPYLR